MVVQQTVLSLVHTVLNNVPADIPTDFSANKYLSFAKDQQLEAMFIAGFLKSGIAVSQEARRNLRRLALISSKQMTVANQIYEICSAHQIDYMPLKGCIMKTLYSSDELRSMSDIDILIRLGQYKRFRQLLLSAGFQECYESTHEYVWDKNGIHVELHKCLVPPHNKDYHAYYGDGWQLAKPTDVPYRYEMSHEDTFIYLFTHYAKHYRDAGAGIRQALDLYVYRKAYPDMDEQYIQQTLTLLQLERFYANTMHMLDVWFGDAQHTEASQLISDRLFASGVYGSYDNYIRSMMLKQKNSQGTLKKAKLQRWFKRIFLPYAGMRQLYPVLSKCPILLPVMWVVRWGNIILHKRDRFWKYIAEDNTLTDASVEKYHEMLKKSGLDFNFK